MKAGALAHVLLRIVTDAEREQLHQFAREVLVGVRLLAARVVEPFQHRAIACDVVRQLAPVSQRVAAQQLVLLDDIEAVNALGVGGRGEVAVQEQRHLLLQRRGRGQHPVEPPGDVRDVLLAAKLGLLLTALDGGRIPRLVADHHREADLRTLIVEQLRLRIRGHRRKAHERGHRIGGRHRCVVRHVTRRSAEGSAAQQMGGQTRAPRTIVGS